MIGQKKLSGRECSETQGKETLRGRVRNNPDPTGMSEPAHGAQKGNGSPETLGLYMSSGTPESFLIRWCLHSTLQWQRQGTESWSLPVKILDG